MAKNIKKNNIFIDGVKSYKILLSLSFLEYQELLHALEYSDNDQFFIDTKLKKSISELYIEEKLREEAKFQLLISGNEGVSNLNKNIFSNRAILDLFNPYYEDNSKKSNDRSDYIKLKYKSWLQDIFVMNKEDQIQAIQKSKNYPFVKYTLVSSKDPRILDLIFYSLDLNPKKAGFSNESTLDIKNVLKDLMENPAFKLNKNKESRIIKWYDENKNDIDYFIFNNEKSINIINKLCADNKSAELIIEKLNKNLIYLINKDLREEIFEKKVVPGYSKLNIDGEFNENIKSYIKDNYIGRNSFSNDTFNLIKTYISNDKVLLEKMSDFLLNVYYPYTKKTVPMFQNKEDYDDKEKEFYESFPFDCSFFLYLLETEGKLNFILQENKENEQNEIIRLIKDISKNEVITFKTKEMFYNNEFISIKHKEDFFNLTRKLNFKEWLKFDLPDEFILHQNKILINSHDLHLIKKALINGKLSDEVKHKLIETNSISIYKIMLSDKNISIEDFKLIFNKITDLMCKYMFTGNIKDIYKTSEDLFTNILNNIGEYKNIIKYYQENKDSCLSFFKNNMIKETILKYVFNPDVVSRSNTDSIFDPEQFTGIKCSLLLKVEGPDKDINEFIAELEGNILNTKYANKELMIANVKSLLKKTGKSKSPVDPVPIDFVDGPIEFINIPNKKTKNSILSTIDFTKYNSDVFSDENVEFIRKNISNTILRSNNIPYEIIEKYLSLDNNPWYVVYEAMQHKDVPIEKIQELQNSNLSKLKDKIELMFKDKQALEVKRFYKYIDLSETQEYCNKNREIRANIDSLNFDSFTINNKYNIDDSIIKILDEVIPDLKHKDEVKNLYTRPVTKQDITLIKSESLEEFPF